MTSMLSLTLDGQPHSFLFIKDVTVRGKQKIGLSFSHKKTAQYEP